MLRVLTECSNAVCFGLQSINQMTKDSEEYLLSEDGFHSYGPYGPKLKLEQKKEIARNWLLNKGFEDLVRAATNPMISLGVIVDFKKRLKIKSNKMTLEELKQMIVDPDINNRSSKHTLSQLLEKVSPFLKNELSFFKYISSMQEIRNLLVHRNGKVTQLDIKEDEHVTLKWVRPKGLFISSDNNTVIELENDANVKGPGSFGITFEETTRQFSLNQPINISFKEFSEMIYTVNLFGQDLIEKFHI